LARESYTLAHESLLGDPMDSDNLPEQGQHPAPPAEQPHSRLAHRGSQSGTCLARSNTPPQAKRQPAQTIACSPGLGSPCPRRMGARPNASHRAHRGGPPGPPTRTVVVPTLPPEWDCHTLPITAPSPRQRRPSRRRPRPIGGLRADLPTVARQQMWGRGYRGHRDLVPGHPRTRATIRPTTGRPTATADDPGLEDAGTVRPAHQAALADAEQAIATAQEPTAITTWPALGLQALALAALRVDAAGSRGRTGELAGGDACPQRALVIYTPVACCFDWGAATRPCRRPISWNRSGSGLAPSPLLTYQGVGSCAKANTGSAGYSCCATPTGNVSTTISGGPVAPRQVR
jgi:hypothetical protein